MHARMTGRQVQVQPAANQAPQPAPGATNANWSNMLQMAEVSILQLQLHFVHIINRGLLG